MAPNLFQTRAISRLRQVRAYSTAASMATNRAPRILPSNVPVEEEGAPEYDPKHFCPVNPRDLFHNRYEMVAKIGWGRSSTVWLARDTTRHVSVWLEMSSL